MRYQRNKVATANEWRKLGARRRCNWIMQNLQKSLHLAARKKGLGPVVAIMRAAL